MSTNHERNTSQYITGYVITHPLSPEVWNKNVNDLLNKGYTCTIVKDRSGEGMIYKTNTEFIYKIYALLALLNEVKTTTIHAQSNINRIEEIVIQYRKNGILNKIDLEEMNLMYTTVKLDLDFD
jgi:hypothetical protein